MNNNLKKEKEYQQGFQNQSVDGGITANNADGFNKVKSLAYQAAGDQQKLAGNGIGKTGAGVMPTLSVNDVSSNKNPLIYHGKQTAGETLPYLGNSGGYAKLSDVQPIQTSGGGAETGEKNDGIKIYSEYKPLDPVIAREIWRRQNGYEADPNIDLSEYGVDENTDPFAALREGSNIGTVGKNGVAEKTESVQPTMQDQYDNASNEIINSLLNGGSDYYNQAADLTRPDYSNSYEDTQNKLLDNYINGENPYYQKADGMTRPEYESKYGDQITENAGKILNYGDYQSDPRVNEALDMILNGKEFSYDINKDSLYKNYKDQYTRAAQLAAEDAIGRASAASGGYGSSYASAASQQSYNQQMQGLSNKIPELYQLAYDKYQDDKQDAYNQYNLLKDADNTSYSRFENGRQNLFNEQNMLQNLENQGYDQYRDSVGDFENERNYLTGQGDRYDSTMTNRLNAVNNASDRDYNRYRDSVSDWEGDRSFLTGLGDREVGNLETAAGLIGNQNDRITDRTRYDDEKQFNDAAAAAELGDFSLMSDYLGVDLKDAETWDKVQKGMSLFSATGMLDYLKAAGLDTTVLESQMADEQFNTKLAAAVSIYEATGDSAALKNLGIDTSYMDQIMQYTLAKAAKEANKSSGGSGGSSRGSGGSGGYVSNDDTPKGDDPATIAANVMKNFEDSGVTWDSQTVGDYISSNYPGLSIDEQTKVLAMLKSLGMPQSHRT